jgi:hypothetical protein
MRDSRAAEGSSKSTVVAEIFYAVYRGPAMFSYKFKNNHSFRRGRLNAVLLMSALIIAVAVSPAAYSHGPGAEKSAETVAATLEQKNQAGALNRKITDLMTDYRSADASEKPSLIAQMTRLAQERRQTLLELMESDPAFVWSMTLPDSDLANLPDSALNLFEETEAAEGELVVLHVDHANAKQSRYEYFLNTPAGQRFSLHFAANPPGLLSGDKIRVHGRGFFRTEVHAPEEADGTLLIESGDAGITILAKGNPNVGNTGTSSTATAPSTLGERRTLVILVNFKDNPVEPWTADYARNVVFGATSDFMFENSSRQTWLSGDVAGWFTIDLSSTVCDIDTLAYQAKNAAAASGIVLTNYQHIIYSFPKNGCGGLGIGTVGGNPSQAWIIGSLDMSKVSHELGHNLGLYHAKALECGTTSLGDNCTVMAYGNAFDAMGNTYAGHYNAFLKERLGWLNAGNSPGIMTVDGSGTYSLDVYESAGTGPKALKILKSTDPVTGKRTWYYVEARQAIGFDAFLSGFANVINGVLIHTGTEGNGDSSYLLDLTPSSQLLTTKDWLDPALTAGESFTDPVAGVTITADSVTATGAAVTVMYSGGGSSTGTSSPTVSVSTDSALYTKGQTVTVMAIVTVGENLVSNTGVNFKITESNGSVSNASVTTGSDGVAVYKYRLRKQAPPGIYKAESVATVNGVSASAATQFTVQ